MSLYLVKSKENLEAADKLIYDHELYCSSVHCSYYACVLVIIYILEKTINRTSDELQDDASDEATGFHVYIKNKVFEPLFKDRSRDSAVGDRFRELGELKNLRRYADYYDSKIDDDDSIKGLKQAQKIRSFLISRYNIEE